MEWIAVIIVIGGPAFAAYMVGKSRKDAYLTEQWSKALDDRDRWLRRAKWLAGQQGQGCPVPMSLRPEKYICNGIMCTECWLTAAVEATKEEK